jgi:uncharacterized radical SAM superfamily Fe-S cluster-containing enzyme
MPRDQSRSLESVCPVCLARIAARHERRGDDVYLTKLCPEHGEFSTVVWRGEPAITDWGRRKLPSRPARPATGPARGCPFDCGLCPEHNQHTCTAVVDVTARCNLACPTCFASAGTDGPADPPIPAIRAMLTAVRAASGPCNIQLSGGEPTVRDDLPEIIALTKELGFPFVQVNTNGVRLAAETGYARALAQAGLDSAFFQFDGLDDAVYTALRGAPLLGRKLAALDAMAEAGIGVVLVPTVVPGVNDHALGAILSLAADRSPAVRGVHFQPVSYFGRYDRAPKDKDRITLPEIMRGLEAQTTGLIRADDFLPPGCEHSRCSFHANYLVMEDGGLQRVSAGRGCCDTSPILASQGADKAKRFVSRQWAAPGPTDTPGLSLPMAPRRDDSGASGCSCAAPDDLDRFLARASTHLLAVSAMAFQDAWTLDLDRLRGCCIHAVAPDGRLVPFCAYNLTAMDGTPLYRGTTATDRTRP